ncbi:hypothetical protein [Bacillus licheniformis]|uniref:hypothetical protein n=1 Tax=Bacillus licheniformis TaxID=1402 RepID=UPI002E2214A5|nr:hypothetical protein [Bacillus licheniformis]
MKAKARRLNIDLMIEKAKGEQSIREMNFKRYLSRLELQYKTIDETLKGVNERLRGE